MSGSITSAAISEADFVSFQARRYPGAPVFLSIYVDDLLPLHN